MVLPACKPAFRLVQSKATSYRMLYRRDAPHGASRVCLGLRFGYAWLGQFGDPV